MSASAGPALDVAVVGDGPAGLALAAACRTLGLAVAVVGDGRPWSATYGMWRDEVDLPDHCFGHVSTRTVVEGRRHHDLVAPHAVRRRPRTALPDDDHGEAERAAGGRQCQTGRAVADHRDVELGPGRGAHRAVSRDASRSASISVGRYVLAQGMSGNTEASATCSAS